MPDTPVIDIAGYLPADPAAPSAWPGGAGAQRSGMHRTAYGLGAFASRSEYPAPASFAVLDSFGRMHLSVWLRDGVEVVDMDGRAFRIAGRDAVMAFLPGVPWTTRFRGLAHHVGLLLRPEVLHVLGGAQAERFLERLRAEGFLRVGAVGAACLRAAHELDAVLLAPGSSDLLREAKSLELLARMLDAGCAAPDPGRPAGRRLARLRQARELLLADPAHAPTIADLARACGLNAFELKQGFRRLYGMSVHALWQQERMRHAWALIESGKASASEAGSLIGYTNMSHFGAAFRRAFGVLPGELRRRAGAAPHL